jgi:predicted glutamine amidotransferase
VCRLFGYCAREDAAVADLIGEEGLGALIALSALHGDGWGMAWYEAPDAAGPEPVIRKSPLRADEPEFEKMARQPLSDLGLVHLRWATPGLAINDLNTHPFRHGCYTFAHNGAVHPQERLGEILPPEWEARVAGTTESERYLLLIMSSLEANGGDMAAAIAEAADQIERKFAPNSLNAILLSPQYLYGISWHDRDKARPRSCASAAIRNARTRSPATSTWPTWLPVTPSSSRAQAGRRTAGSHSPTAMFSSSSERH